MTTGTALKTVLDLTKRNPKVEPLMKDFERYIVGQPNATEKMTELVETFMAGTNAPGRPAGSALFLGPTGTGKTRLVEALAKSLLGDERACIKIDCGEFQHSHEIAKLIGSPPGYLGHRETPPLLTQEALNQWHTEKFKMSIVLFDEIEKASDSLWQLLLGVMDKATLTLGDNRRVDFSKTIIILTSNLGSADMADLMKGGFGFRPAQQLDVSDEKNASVALQAARKHFTPEFMNRIDHVVTFNTLTEPQIREIMTIELGRLQQELWASYMFLYQLSDKAKDRVMEEGYSKEYGARELKRVIDRRVRAPLSRLIGSGQIEAGDCIIVDDKGGPAFEFNLSRPTKKVTFKEPEGDIL